LHSEHEKLNMFSNTTRPETAGPHSPSADNRKHRAGQIIVVVTILVIYSYPAIRTYFATGWSRMPAVSAPDLGLYLSISELERTSDGQILNPYYHVPVPYAVSYLKFRLGPWLFGGLDRLFGERICFSLMIWNLLWWALLCLSVIWLFQRLLPNPDLLLTLAGVSLLTLFGLDGFGHVMAAWVHSVPMKLVGSLPFLRPFNPQVMMPMFVCYLGLQVRALREKSAVPWIGLVVLQFVAFTAFPFATMMMAGLTAIPVLWYVVSAPKRISRVVVFTLGCAIPDIAFAMRDSAGFRLSFPEEGSIFHFHPHLIPQMIGKSWLLIAVLVLATALAKKLPPEIKWPLVSLGMANLLLKFGDVFVSERVFFISDHIGYFYQPTIVILFIFLVSAYMPSRDSSLCLTSALLAVIVFCVVYGLLMAEGNYRTNLAYNQEQADLDRWISGGDISPQDLILTSFEGTAYDDCEFIPLLSQAEVLYCRNAQLTLTATQNRDVQRLREVLYMYFDGKDSQWLENATQFERYGVYGELSSYRTPKELQARIVQLRNELRPIFLKVESDDPSIRDFFRRFRRVWIVENSQRRGFSNEKLGAYLKIENQEITGSLVAIQAKPK